MGQAADGGGNGRPERKALVWFIITCGSDCLKVVHDGMSPGFSLETADPKQHTQVMLADYAVQVEHSRGRRHCESAHPYRNDFQRDRDRVIHARAFRRMENKTQVFTRRYSDHFRNRLTHTIEVAQISRTIAGQLGLNLDLVEALALVHDLGHPPFGHAGEKALDRAMREHGGKLIDCQMHTPHLASLGAITVAREAFINYLKNWLPDKAFTFTTSPTETPTVPASLWLKAIATEGNA